LKDSNPSILENRSNYKKFKTPNPVVKFLLNNFYSKIKNIVSEIECTSFLDAGCGQGMTLQYLADMLPAKVKAFDFDPACIEYAKEKFPSVDFCVADISKLPFKDKSFDLSICLEVLEHLPSQKRECRNYYGSLKIILYCQYRMNLILP